MFSVPLWFNKCHNNEKVYCVVIAIRVLPLLEDIISWSAVSKVQNIQGLSCVCQSIYLGSEQEV